MTGKEAKQIRLKSGLSQDDFAAKTGIARARLAKFEARDTVLKQPDLDKINAWTNVPNDGKEDNELHDDGVPYNKNAPDYQGELLMKAILNLTDGIKLIEQNRKLEAENNSRLITMLEERAIEGARAKMPAGLNEGLEAFQEFVITHLAKVTNIPPHILAAELGSKKMHHLKQAGKADIRTGKGN